MSIKINDPISVILLGKATTGKTSLMNRLIKDKFTHNTEATIGASFMSVDFNNKKYHFWDTAGQERYLSLAPIYYRRGEIIILVFDTSQLYTIDRMIYYLDRIKEELAHKYEVIIVGTKTDLANHGIDYIDQIVKEKLSNFDDIIKDTDYVYVSAKTPSNFDILLTKIKEKGQIIQIARSPNENSGLVNINAVDPSTTMSKISCGYCV